MFTNTSAGIGMEPQWMRWAKGLQAIAQSGLTFTENAYEIERYEAVRQIAAEMLAAGSTIDQESLLELMLRERGYATPKIDTRGVCFRDGRILLVKERVDGKWTLPGGWADVNDSPSENVVKEIFQESGFTARAVKLLALYDRTKHPHTPAYVFHLYKIFFLCEITGGEPATSLETSDVGFFAEDALPELSVGRTTEAQIHRMFEHSRHPEWPADFD
jgi:ADP-ribose pyrophosphatase YjhB (NUDIX family)